MLESGREAITVSEVDSFASRLNAILVSDMSTVSRGPLWERAYSPAWGSCCAYAHASGEPGAVTPPSPRILRTCLR